MPSVAGDSALRISLEALAACLDRTRSLADTVAHLEAELCAAFGARALDIRLFFESPSAARQADASAVPLTVDGEAIGEIVAYFETAPATGLLEDLGHLSGALAATLLWRLQSEDRARLRRIARTDPLTGLANRLSFDERLETAVRSCSERGAPLALTFLDIDFFKAFNDIYGHVAGDECLRRVAGTLGANLRPNELLARYGGEEFALIAEGTTITEATIAVERLAFALETLSIPHSGSTLGRVSISAGISGRVPTIADSIGDLMRDTDRALYRAKMLGRNRIVASDDYVSSAPIVTRATRSLGAPPAFENATIGRDDDVARILAATRNARMLTLVGPAGIGKSRLARAAGIAAQSTVPDGVAYVDLGVLSNASDALTTLAAALDIGLDGTGFFDSIREVLRDRRMLLIFDDIVADPDRRIEKLCDDLLAALPHLSILATSRHALGARDERVVVVAPLDEAAGVALLCARAALGGASADDPTLGEIVRLTRGVPSSIEGVARYLAINGPASTLQRLR